LPAFGRLKRYATNFKKGTVMPKPTTPKAWMQPFAELFGIRRPVVQETHDASEIDVVVVANRDVYHLCKNSLLLKEGQHVGPKTLDTLEKIGISVLECCSVKRENGTLEPLELSILRYILKKTASQKATRFQLNTVLSLQERRVESSLEAWQRHFKVLIVAHNKRDQERLRTYLESQGVLAQHIHPVLQASMFEYLYEKYKPTCLIVDLRTHQNFLKQGIDVLQRPLHCPFACLENTVLLTSPPVAFHFDPELLQLETVWQIPHPLIRQDLDRVLHPLFNRLRRLYFEAPNMHTVNLS
jgi:hypothetical protein